MKTFKSILALTLALVLVFSLGLTSFADEPAKQTALYISKDLKIAEGTTTPAVTFNFTFTPNEEESIGIKNISEFVPLSASLSFNNETVDADKNEVITLVTPNILADKANAFPHAGTYVYNVAETNVSWNVEGEAMICDSTVYKVVISVVNTTDGKTVIDNVIITDPNGDKVTSDDDGTEGNGSETDINDTDFEASNGFRFENTYTKKSNSGPSPNEGVSLKISNDIVGKSADRTKPFTYELTVYKASTDTATEYSYVVGGETKTALFGEKVTFTLKDDEVFTASGIIAGAHYDITEKGAEKYTITADVDGNSEAAEMAADLAITNVLIKETGSVAAFTTTFDDSTIPPTGIIINNLPFVMLIAVSGLCLCFFLVAKKRRSEEA